MMRLVWMVRVERRRVGEGAFFFLGGMTDAAAAAVCIQQLVVVRFAVVIVGVSLPSTEPLC